MYMNQILTTLKKLGNVLDNGGNKYYTYRKQDNTPITPVRPVEVSKKEEEKPVSGQESIQTVQIVEPALIIETPKYPDYYKNLYVILDNGHGSNTSGKRSPDGKLREYKYCREIVQEISKRLTKIGIGHHILVPEDIDISLKERVIRANKIHQEQHANKKTVILLSVHCNAAGDGEWKNARGWSAWTSVGATSSDEIATCLYKAAHEVLDCKKIKIREDNSDGDPDWESNFYILQKSSMPAVLTENFFQDNKEDVKYLLSDEGREDVINIHVEGIKKYADLKFNR